jgi:hypothetical protein
VKTRSEKAKAPMEILKCGTVMAMVSKRSESFDNDFFFDIEAKRTRSIVRKLISKRSEFVYILKNLIIQSKRSQLILNCESSEATRTCSMVKIFIFKRSEHIDIKEFKHRSEANTFDSLKSYFGAKRTCFY